MPEPRCVACACRHRTFWTPERIIDRIQEWAVVYGEPPAVNDWRAWQAENILHDPVRAARFRAAGGYWPAARTVFDVFPSWNAALVAAGFEPRPAHGGGGNELRRRVKERLA